MDRRSGTRCPICQGPGVEDASKPEGVRCRRSTCIQNHSHAECPRCKSKHLESVTFQDATYVYKCEDCTNTWKVKEGV